MPCSRSLSLSQAVWQEFAPANAYHINVDGPPTPMVRAGPDAVSPSMADPNLHARRKGLTAGPLGLILNVNVNVKYGALP